MGNGSTMLSMESALISGTQAASMWESGRTDGEMAAVCFRISLVLVMKGNGYMTSNMVSAGNW
eukprot:CAMPEP_0201281416 /NCGR_PEP_ID=MMETSP1317-20130820/2660_1 /ASSEMBLY_ACC=CAM_ASM_000770 /TAXON_ID=187299 /ORGANISM="Undescribed Undescribed, Strain Undescribed" /LENGTH=62 /DNA_ID=CAMNT_0047591147 /DNA_START=654 /DNA_END=839 /DNA_ORIENTATION=-